MRQWDKYLSSPGLGFLIFKKRTFSKRILKVPAGSTKVRNRKKTQLLWKP